MTEMMRAVVIDGFGGVEVLKLREVPKPQPGEGEVLVRIKAAGVNPVDWKIREGLLEKRGIPHRFPVILGWDMAGVVEAIGFSARRFKPGDEVYAYCRRPLIHAGCYAQYISIPESYIAKKPKTASFETAGAIPLAALTAYQSVYTAAQIKEGETALILGASGGVGSYAVQYCRIVGARVVAVASGANDDYLRKLGAEVVIDYTKQDFAEALRDVAPEGVDFVHDCIGGDALEKAYLCVKKGGRLVDIVQPPNQTALDEKNGRALYVFVEPHAPQLDHIASLTDAGQLKTTISKVWKLEEVQEAHRQLEPGHTRGKMVISIT